MTFLAENFEAIAALWAAFVVFASAVANVVPKKTIVGRVVHFIALNFKIKDDK